MNNHPHPPRARAEKRLSLSKKWTKEAFRKKKAFHERARGNITTHNCLSIIFSHWKFPIWTQKIKERPNSFLEREERMKERLQKQHDERARERWYICVVARNTKKSPHVPQQMKVRRYWEYFFSFPLGEFFLFWKSVSVLCLSLSLFSSIARVQRL